MVIAECEVFLSMIEIMALSQSAQQDFAHAETRHGWQVIGMWRGGHIGPLQRFYFSTRCPRRAGYAVYKRCGPAMLRKLCQAKT